MTFAANDLLIETEEAVIKLSGPVQNIEDDLFLPDSSDNDDDSSSQHNFAYLDNPNTSSNWSIGSEEIPQHNSSFQEMYFQPRFNPFSSSILPDENYFKPEPTLNLQYSRSQPNFVNLNNLLDNSSRLVDSQSVGSLEEELIVDDDFFGNSLDVGLTREEELMHAVEKCKSKVKSTEGDTRDSLVQQLIQLRLQLFHIRESSNCKDTKTTAIAHHLFTPRRRRRQTCEQCGRRALAVVWQQCVYCGTCCHENCLMLFTRQCVRNLPQVYELRLCPETGLARQEFRCSECRVRITYPTSRLCEYSGGYFCLQCHWNDLAVIPARVLLNWDFTPGKISRRSRYLLRMLQKKPIIKVDSINSHLYNFVEDLSQIRRLRISIMRIKVYLMACKTASNNRVLLKLHSKQHFVDGWDYYTIKDLIEVQTGTLLPFLQNIVQQFVQHIRGCDLCNARGFVCEVCKSDKVVFPFEDSAICCERCNGTYHQDCFEKNSECPRCMRRAKRRQSQNS